ncbi:MAG: hypothetical protein M3112_03445 [Actinomycetia bacterium]|nr:hypothetical protein [Actinomycetes bacterium]
MQRPHVLIMVGLIALVLAACGGTSDESSSDTAASSSTSPSSDQAADPADVPDAGSDDQTVSTVGSIGDHFDTAGGTATVTIGDETWEFALPEGHLIANCDADFFGGFVAILTSGTADISIPADTLIVMLPGGDVTDPPTVRVKLAVGSDAEWIADETIYEQYPDLPAGLGVTSFSIDGTTASGSAMFFEQESVYQFSAGNGDLVVADGTFTVTCAAE